MKLSVVSIVILTVGAICLSSTTAIAQDETADQLQIQVDETKNKAAGNENKIETLGKNFQILQDQIDDILQLCKEPASYAASTRSGEAQDNRYFFGDAPLHVCGIRYRARIKGNSSVSVF